MNMRSMQRRLGLALVVVSIATYCIADSNLAMLILAVPASIAAWLLTMPPAGKPLPRIVINLILVGILAYTLFTIATRGFEITTVCEIIVLTLVAKILDRRSQRDVGQIISICVFLCIGTVLTSNGFWVGMLLIVCLGLLVAYTLVYQVARLTDPDLLAQPPPLRAGRRVKIHLRRLTLVMTCTGLVISAFVFIFMPRSLGAGVFGTWGNPAVGQVTGFADEVELGTPGFISPSSVPVLDLEVVGHDGAPRGAPDLVYYLRGAVLDTYDRGRWTHDSDWAVRTPRHRIDALLTGFPVGGEPRDWDLAQHITIRNAAATRSHLFTLWRPVFFQPEQPAAVYSADDGTLIRESEGGKFEYTVLSRDYELRDRYQGKRDWWPADPVYAPDMDTERITNLARRILIRSGLDPDPLTRPTNQIEHAATRLEEYFRTGFVYTLQAEPVPPGRDPTEWFLFDHKAGHCEFYASAMAVLCRDVGINARVITGYVATEFNEATGHYVVRQSNAHAWVEVEVGPGVWRTFDPTPPADFQRLHETSHTLLAQARRLLDAAEYAWIRTVVSFDARKQRAMFRSAFNLNFKPDQAVESFIVSLRKQGPKGVLSLIGTALLAAACVGLLVLVASLYRRRVAQLLARWWTSLLLALRPRNELRSVYLRFLRLLERRGSAKPAGVPLLTHVQRAAAAWPMEDRLRAERLAHALYRARFHASNPALIRQCADDLAVL